METELKTEIKKGLENPEVDKDLKAEETNNLSTGSSDPRIESMEQLCEMHGYELAFSDPAIGSNHILENDPDYSLQAEQTGGRELKNKLMETVVAVIRQQDTSTQIDNSSNNTQARHVEPVKSFENLCSLEVEESKAAEEFESEKELKTAGGSDGNGKNWKAAEGPDDDSVMLSDEDDDSDGGPSNTSDEPDVPCVGEDLQTFMNKLNSEVSLWKDGEDVWPPEIKQIILESDAANSLSGTTCQEVNSAESIDTPEWQNMNYSEKITFIRFRQAGISREVAVAKINETRLERGTPILTRKTPSQEVASQSSQSPETCTEGDTQKVANETEELKLDLEGEELTTFRELQRIGLPREGVWAKIREARAKLESCGKANAWKYNKTVKANLAASKAQKMASGKKRRKLSRRQLKRTEQNMIFKMFTNQQRVLYKELRENDKNMAKPAAMNKVVQISEKLGIKNTRLVDWLSSRGGGTFSNINQAQIDVTTNVPTSSDSAAPNCQQPVDRPENIAESSDVEECWKRYPKYSDLLLGLFRYPNCRYSLDEIIEMAERIPEGYGIYARKLFVLRSYKYGVDPEGWDWKQYSEIPPVPKTLKAPPRHLQKPAMHQQNSKQPSCTHSSCKYYSAPVAPLKEQHRQGSRAGNVGVRNESFRPHQNDPHNLPGIPPLMALDVPGSSSYEEGQISYDESRELKRRKFVEEPIADSPLAGTQPSQDLHLYIVPSHYPSELLDDEEMNEIENSILAAILKIDDERMRPIFNGSFHNNGRYEVICQDQFSKEWLYKYIRCLSPTAYLKTIPAELSNTSDVPPQCNNCQSYETQSRYSHEPGYVPNSSDSRDQGPTERLVYVDPLLHDQPSSSKQALQDRLGPKIKSPCGREPSMQVSQDEPRSSKRSHSPKCSGDPSEYTDPLWDVSTSARNSHERIRVEVTKSPSPTRSRYVKPSLHDHIRRDVSRSRCSNYGDYGEHSGYAKPSGYAQPNSSYRDSPEGYDPSLVVTRSQSPEYNRPRYVGMTLGPGDYLPGWKGHSGYNEPSWRDGTPNSGQNTGRHHSRSPRPEYRSSRDRSRYYEPARSQSPEYNRPRYVGMTLGPGDYLPGWKGHSGYNEPSWRDGTPNSGQNTGRHHSRSPSPEYRESRDRSGCYESSRDSYHRSHSPEESRSDARERLMRIRTNRASASYTERDCSSPERSYSSRAGHPKRLRSPPPYSRSASRTNRSKYNPSRQYPPPPSFSRHFSKHL